MMEEQEVKKLDFDALLRSDRDYQSACDKKVSQALTTARANWERERQAEGDRLRQEMESELERRMTEERAGLAAQQSAFDRRLRQVAVAEALQQRGLDARFAPWITGETEEDSALRVEQFTSIFQAALSQAVAGRMRGDRAPRAPEQPEALTKDTLKGMSAREINRNWEQVSGLLRDYR